MVKCFAQAVDDLARVAVVPMAFCFPGYDAKGADLPPPPLCAKHWRAEVLASLPGARDYWAVLAQTPAVAMGRVDVGGSGALTSENVRAAHAARVERAQAVRQLSPIVLALAQIALGHADEAVLWKPWLSKYAALEKAYETGVWNPRPSGLCRRHCPVVECPHNGST